MNFPHLSLIDVAAIITMIASVATTFSPTATMATDPQIVLFTLLIFIYFKLIEIDNRN